MLIKAYKKSGVATNCDGEEDEDNAPVGYARKQAKSTAFWGPRRTPISTKIKKKIIKEKRLKKKEKQQSLLNDTESSEVTLSNNEQNEQNDNGVVDDAVALSSDAEICEEPSYVETVRQIKRDKKARQLQKQGRKNQTSHEHILEEKVYNDNAEVQHSASSDDLVESEEEQCENSSNDSSSGINGFAALTLFDDSDDE